MNYHEKYIKYKQKYLNARNLQKAGNNFKILKLLKEDIIYHGTLKMIIGDFKPPTFYSKDMLQSLGHILSGNFLTDEHKMRTTSFLPTIYSFSPKEDFSVLDITYPNNIDQTIDRLYNIPLLYKYILASKKSNNIMYLAYYNMLQYAPGNKLVKELKNNECIFEKGTKIITNPEINYLIILEVYKKICHEACFGGTIDTIGYRMLSNIDYNSYFRELGFINQDDTVYGLYVENDQDAIILFDTNKFKINDQFIVLPYFYKNKTFLEQTNFIKGYLCAIKNKETNYKQLDRIPKYLKQYNYLYNLPKNSSWMAYMETARWNFFWNETKCSYYDPYKKIYDETKPIGEAGCAEFESCKIETEYVRKSDLGCVKPWKSIKITIQKKEYIDALKDYIEIIKTWKISLFEDIIKQWKDSVHSEK